MPRRGEQALDIPAPPRWQRRRLCAYAVNARITGAPDAGPAGIDGESCEANVAGVGRKASARPVRAPPAAPTERPPRGAVREIPRPALRPVRELRPFGRLWPGDVPLDTSAPVVPLTNTFIGKFVKTLDGGTI